MPPSCPTHPTDEAAAVAAARLGVLCVREDGAIEGLHDDALALHEVGTLQVRRASDVEFAAEDGCWTAVEASTGAVIATDVVRGRCIAAEVAHFTAALLAGLRPFAPADPPPTPTAGRPTGDVVLVP